MRAAEVREQPGLGGDSRRDVTRAGRSVARPNQLWPFVANFRSTSLPDIIRNIKIGIRINLEGTTCYDLEHFIATYNHK